MKKTDVNKYPLTNIRSSITNGKGRINLFFNPKEWRLFTTDSPGFFQISQPLYSETLRSIFESFTSIFYYFMLVSDYIPVVIILELSRGILNCMY